MVDLYAVPDVLAQPGTPLGVMLEHRVQTGNFEGSDAKYYIARLLQLVEERQPSMRQAELAVGRIVSIRQQPVAGVGWIATHEPRGRALKP